MKTISLKIVDDAIEVNYVLQRGNKQSRKIIISYNDEQSIGENLETIRVKLVGVTFDAIIIENPLSYSFSDTIIGINHQRINIGLALTNMFNVPVVAQPTVKEIGLEKAITAKQEYNSWHLDYYGQYKDKRNFGQESMLTVGNGFFGLRGAYVEARADQDNYPGMYVAGLYNQNTTNINGRDVVNEDLVNLPNAQYLTFGIDNSNPFKIKKSDIRDIYRSLDLHTGELTTSMVVNLSTGHQLEVKATKIADMQQWHRFAIRYEITPLNFTGNMQIYSEIDGHVINDNVARYSEFDQRHIDITSMGTSTNEAVLSGQTKNSQIEFAIGTKLTSPDVDAKKKIITSNTSAAVRQILNINVESDHTYTFDKSVAVFTSLECKSDDLDQLVLQEVDQANFESTQQHTQQFFTNMWQEADVQITGDLTSQKLSRVNIFHLFVSAESIGKGKLDASVGARGLHGEAYRGHVFWDEMFIIPFYASHYPDLAKQLLMYRYNRLGAARKYAKSEGYQGAMYPWQSGMVGDEQSQYVHLNPITNQWDPDNSRLQRHVSLSVAYDVWLYLHLTDDQKFMTDYGLEMLLSIAKFWLSMTTYDKVDKRYSIHGVMGPDEFHEEYPNSDEQGLTNNAYTNIMVAWLFKLVKRLAGMYDSDTLQQLNEKAGLTDEDYQEMDKVSHNLKLDINEHGIIGQFEGYFNLPTLNFDNYRKKYGDISRLDRILKSEGKTPDAYQVAKQADALMAYYNFDVEDVDAILSDMGYHLPTNYLTHNLQFYLDRTTHGSTLSRVVYAALTEYDDNMDQSWKFFHQALFSDYYDIQGGTTAEGIHLGVMGATIALETRVYGGVDLLGDQIKVSPHLPSKWQQLAFTQHFHGIRLDFEITHHKIKLTADHDINLAVIEQPVELKENQTMTIEY